MSFPQRAGPRTCPVEGCSERASMRTAMRVHFWNRHVRDTVVILEEGNLPQPRRPLREMLVLLRSLNRMHRCTEKRKRGVERNQRRLAEEEEREVTTRAFSAYRRPLERVTSFRYLGWVISVADDEWPAVVKNLSQARAVWKRMKRTLSRERVEPQVSGFFFKDVVQAVLLFGSETWAVTPSMGRALGGFQYQVARRMMGRIPWRKPDEKRKYTSEATEREDTGLQKMEEYIWQRQNTVTQYIATQSLIDLCEGS